MDYKEINDLFADKLPDQTLFAIFFNDKTGAFITHILGKKMNLMEQLGLLQIAKQSLLKMGSTLDENQKQEVEPTEMLG